MTTLLNVEGAGFSYSKEGTAIFQDIGFTVEKGQVFCLLGPNGCGKTSLLDCILGLYKLNRGSIYIQGRNMKSFKPGQIAQYIAYVPQRHEGSFPYTVMEMVQMGRAAYTDRFSSPSAEDKKIAREALELVGLSHLRHRPFTQLSGGESQLVMIARALAQKTPMIVMDEPTSHLDFRHEIVVLETIVHLVKNSGVSIVMATHFPNHVFYFDNQELPAVCALMHMQGFLAMGRAGEVLNEQNMRKLYGVNTRLIKVPWDQERDLRHLVPVNTAATEV
ncbi:MAG: ABC transporter ATP-binding protein [Syntrophomonadaceae bacterium]